MSGTKNPQCVLKGFGNGYPEALLGRPVFHWYLTGYQGTQTGYRLLLKNRKEDLLWDLLAMKKRGDVFVFFSATEVPEKLLPYTVLNRYLSYGVDAIRPTSQDVAAYMKNRGILLSKEELLRIEKDTNNMPLYIQMLVNLLEASERGYRGSVREQCFKDVFTYIDVTFFRTFSKEDQNTLLRIACFEQFDNSAIS